MSLCTSHEVLLDPSTNSVRLGLPLLVGIENLYELALARPDDLDGIGCLRDVKWDLMMCSHTK